MATKPTKSTTPRKTAPAKPAAPDWFINGSLMFSLDKTDPRTVEQVQEAIKKALTNPAARVGVKTVTFTGCYYVVDGKSYRQSDFDPKTGLVREGALYIGENPAARDPKHLKTVAQTMADMKKPRSPREALEDNRAAMGRTVNTRTTKREDDDPEVEFDWDEDDFGSEAVAEVAEKSVEDAVKKLTSTPKKVPAKKTAARKIEDIPVTKSATVKKTVAKKTAAPRRGGRK
jgi:hypothetical protein